MTWADAAPLIAVVGASLFAATFLWRHGGGAALEQLERANGILVRRVAELEYETAAKSEENARLRERTDLAAAFAPVRTMLERQHSEAMAQFGAMTKLLGMVAARLGPEPGED